jgi:hypothetical protein
METVTLMNGKPEEMKSSLLCVIMVLSIRHADMQERNIFVHDR